jgi:magnesium chelatase subunit I
VPRTNRGIFAINELPDLAERIQVGLLNVLEERDVQVRGYKIRLPLDVLLVASANPEDYTNRGRIITPLKDRFGSQIRTHYPLEVETEVAIAHQESRPLDAPGIRVHVPEYMTEIVATLSHLARQSPHINQRSGVSVRLTVSNHETMVANATRRALRLGERDVVPRVSDLDALAASTAGKVEIEALEEGRDEQIVEQLLKSAVLIVFKDRINTDTVREVVAAFDGGTVVHTGEDVSSPDEAHLVADLPALRQPVSELTAGDESPAAVASAVEFILEGLHLSKRLNKDAVGTRATYRGRGLASLTRCRAQHLDRGPRVAVAVEQAPVGVEAVVPLVAVHGGAMEEAADVDALVQRIADLVERGLDLRRALVLVVRGDAARGDRERHVGSHVLREAAQRGEQ